MLDYPGVPNIMTKVFKGGRVSFKEEVRGNEVRVKHEELGTQLENTWRLPWYLKKYYSRLSKPTLHIWCPELEGTGLCYFKLWNLSQR